MRPDMAPGLCIGDRDVAMAQATHGCALAIAGRGISNPYAMIQSTRMMLDWLATAMAIRMPCAWSIPCRAATTMALGDAKARTGDIRGTGDAASFAQAVLRNLHNSR